MLHIFRARNTILALLTCRRLFRQANTLGNTELGVMFWAKRAAVSVNLVDGESLLRTAGIPVI